MTKYIKHIAMILFASMTLSGCAVVVNNMGNQGMGRGIAGNRQIVENQHALSGDFDRVVFTGINGTLNISNEPSSNVAFSIDENLVEHVEIRQSGSTLTIGTRNNQNINPSDATFYIGTDTLVELRSSGAGNIIGTGEFSSDNLDIRTSGAGNLSMDTNVEGTLTINNSGVTNIELRGSAQEVYVRISGAARTNLRELIAQDVDVNLSGTGSIIVYAQNNLDASISGAGSITYYGGPENVNTRVSGIGNIRRGD